MSKRRINKQQSHRIEKMQQRYQIKKEASDAQLFDGLVLSRFNKEVEIEDQQGNKIRCAIRPHLSTLVAGDQIIWQREGHDQGVVVSMKPRTSVLMRPSANKVEKPVAANISQLIIVIAAKPKPSWSLLDSYLIMAELLHIPAIILLNKTDLVCETLKQQLHTDYHSLGYPIIMANQENTCTNQTLHNILNHQLSVFVGQSGVGKSSLIAALLPHEQDIATGAISVISELGTHTTSNSRYYHLPEGGALIDSPGVREFSLWTIDAATIVKGYKEFAPYITQCKFRNCTHIASLHCALIEAVKEHKVSEQRYANFVKLCAQYS